MPDENPFRAQRIATATNNAARLCASELTVAHGDDWRVLVLAHNVKSGETAIGGDVPVWHAAAMLATGTAQTVDQLNQRLAALTHGKESGT